jgi:hypothetical protein
MFQRLYSDNEDEDNSIFIHKSEDRSAPSAVAPAATAATKMNCPN